MRKLAFFSALCFFLSAVEYAIPKPVPFFRLGLANLPIMISFLCMTKKESTALIFLKVLLQGIISGTLFSYIFLFSLAGSVASGFVMMAIFHLFYEKKLISWLGISMAGGLANNLAQLAVAYAFLFEGNTKFIAPVLLAISFVASIAMGIFTQSFVAGSQWLKNISDEVMTVPDPDLAIQDSNQKNSKPFIVKFFCVLVLMVVLFFSDNVLITYGITFAALACSLLTKKKVRILPSLMIIVSVTFFSLLVPHGRIIVEFWKLKITEGALMSGLVRSGRLCGAVFLSKLAVSRDLKLPSRAGAFMSLVFYYFEKLSLQKIKFSRKTFMKSLDDILLEASNSLYSSQ
ncbi:MAG: Gx transporter family protein [Treponema sp.]|nr:Gx transporter family protein [Candidatus Treponema equi]